jgi:hypothetical protein
VTWAGGAVTMVTDVWLQAVNSQVPTSRAPRRAALC